MDGLLSTASYIDIYICPVFRDKFVCIARFVAVYYCNSTGIAIYLPCVHESEGSD